MNRNEIRKNDSPGFAKSLFYAFMIFFGGIPGFVEKRESGRVLFVRDFPEKNLQIVITAPLIADAQDIMYSLNGLYIQFEVRFDGKQCLELVESRVFPNYMNRWRPIVERKINALVGHIEDIRRCSRCTDKVVYPHPIQRAVAQIYSSETNFVQNQCPECEDVSNSTAGKGIKSALHRFLKKKA